MKNRTSIDESRGCKEGVGVSKWSRINNKNKKKKNMMRLGGEGLSLEAFANAKSKNNDYNPAMIKKKREFYRNAKFVNKYKKTVKEQTQPNDLSSAMRPFEQEKRNTEYAGKMNKDKKNNRNRSHSLRELYEKKHEEEEKARTEREAMIQKKREDRENVMAKRKVMKQKMFRKTESGQPLMKYRIENLLQSIQSSTTT